MPSINRFVILQLVKGPTHSQLTLRACLEWQARRYARVVTGEATTYEGVQDA